MKESCFLNGHKIHVIVTNSLLLTQILNYLDLYNLFIPHNQNID
jgi:hypothetical protein